MDGLAELDDFQRAQVAHRWAVLRPHVEDGQTLAVAAGSSGVPLRTAQRWLSRYRAGGLALLARDVRSDRGTRRLPLELVAAVEGLALQRPKPSVATVARRAAQLAQERGWPVPSYSTVHSIVSALNPQLATPAHDGPTALRDRYELVYRRQADRPNALWQADHTELDLLVLDADGRPARPWLTVVLDDHSRAIPGYTVFLGAPSALNLSLALRQAIWVKPDPGWPVHRLPDALYADHGSDFISDHIALVMADLEIQLIHSAVARPQGRGKLERFFGTVTTQLLPLLPGHLAEGRPATPSRLTGGELDAAIGRWIGDTYHQRTHSETGQTPHAAWVAGGWLPRTTDTLEDLDLLLVMVAKPRAVHRDGIRFQGLRYLDSTLAAYVGEPVTIRYDPRDITEIRVFHRNRFLCRAISPEHAGDTVSQGHSRRPRRPPTRPAWPAQPAPRRCPGTSPRVGVAHPAAGTARSGRLLQSASEAAPELLIVDEADRLSPIALERLRDRLDRRHLGLLLIGMPGIDKRLFRYPQLYSRIGFAHQYRPLLDDELTFVLTRH